MAVLTFTFVHVSPAVRPGPAGHTTHALGYTSGPVTHDVGVAHPETKGPFRAPGCLRQARVVLVTHYTCNKYN